MPRALILALALSTLVTVLAAPVRAAKVSSSESYSKEQITSTPFVVWWGDRETMTARELASYCAPVLWFSPDEPLLEGKSGKDIMIPEPFPFEESPGRPGGVLPHTPGGRAR